MELYFVSSSRMGLHNFWDLGDQETQVGRDLKMGIFFTSSKLTNVFFHSFHVVAQTEKKVKFDVCYPG